MPSWDVNWSAPLTSTTAPVSIGQCLIYDPSSQAHILANAANRTSLGRRTDGIAWSAGDVNNRSVILVISGPVPNSVTGLGVGAKSDIRVSATGVLERCTAGVGDEIVGNCETDGSAHVLFGVVPVGGFGGGGSGFTPPTGTGPVGVTAGVLNAAATAINLAGGANFVTGLLPLANQAAPTGTGFVTVTAGAWDGAAATYPIAFAKGGTGNTAFAAGVVKSNGTIMSSTGLGSTLQVLRTNVGVTDVEWATISSGASPGGATNEIQVNDGAGGFAGSASSGTKPATGKWREPYNLGAAVALIKVRNSAAADVNGIQYGGGDGWTYGNTGQDFSINSAVASWIATSTVDIYGGAAISLRKQSDSSVRFSAGTAALTMGLPCIGDSSASSPYSVHGEVDVAMGDANHTLTSSEYIYRNIRTTGALTTTRTLTTPNPAAKADSFPVLFNNNCTGNALTVTTGAGTTMTLAAGDAAYAWVEHNKITNYLQITPW